MAADHGQKIALFINSTDPGGAETLVIDLAVAYRSRGHEVEIWHFGNQWLEKAAARRQSPILELDDRHFRRFYRLPLFAHYLSRVIRNRGITAVHSHLYGAVIAAAPAARLAGCRHVGTLHDVYTLREASGRVYGLRWAERMGTRLVCVSRVIEEEIRCRDRRSWRHLRTIHNGIATDRNQSDSRALASRWQAARTEFVCVARLVPIKNLELLVGAVAALHDIAGHFRVRVIGDGPERGRLEDLAASRGVGDAIKFCGFRDNVDAVLSESHCFILPSLSEGLSCSIMEAMRAGIPVIATDVGGNRELVVDGQTGHLVPSEDTGALARAMRDVVNSRRWAEEAGRAARQRIESYFSVDAMVDAYLAMFASDD